MWNKIVPRFPAPKIDHDMVDIGDSADSPFFKTPTTVVVNILDSISLCGDGHATIHAEL